MSRFCQTCGQPLQYDTKEHPPHFLPCGLCSLCCEKANMNNVDNAALPRLGVNVDLPWCLDCDAEAGGLCRQAHTLCPMRGLEEQAEAELVALRSERAAALRLLDDELDGERRRLGEEEVEACAVARGGQRHGLSELRGMVAAARHHPALLLASAARAAGAPLLRTLAMTAASNEKAARVRQREAGFLAAERARLAETTAAQASLQSREAAVSAAEAALAEKTTQLTQRVAALGGAEANIRSWESVVHGREVSVHGREVAVNDRETIVLAGETSLQERSRALDEREANLAAARARVESWGVVVQEREAAVYAKETAVNVKEASVQAREASFLAREAAVEEWEASVQAIGVDVNIREAAVQAREAAAYVKECSVLAREAAIDTQDAAVQAWEASGQVWEAAVNVKEASVEAREAAVNTQDASVQSTETYIIAQSATTIPEWEQGSVHDKEDVALRDHDGEEEVEADLPDHPAKRSKTAHAASLAARSNRGGSITISSSGDAALSFPAVSRNDDDSNDDHNNVTTTTAASPDADGWCGMDALPDAVLVRILAAVPAGLWSRPDDRSGGGELLALRLVCRRWSRLVLSAPVWCDRRMAITCSSNDFQSAGRCAVLRLVPVLDALRIDATVHGREEENQATVLEAWQESTCKVRSFHMSLAVRHRESCELFVAFLERNGEHLRELRLDVSGSNGLEGPVEKRSLRAVLAAVDRLPALRKLHLYMMNGQGGGNKDAAAAAAADDGDAYTFRHVAALEELTTECVTPRARLVHGLLDACRATLRRLDCCGLDLLARLVPRGPQLAAAPAPSLPQLRHLTLRAGPRLSLLHHLSRPLDTLTINCPDPANVQHVRDFLTDARLDVERVRLVLQRRGFTRTLREAASALRRVKHLTAHDVSHASFRAFLEVLTDMPDLDTLCLHHCDLNNYVDQWTEETVPGLRVLHSVGSWRVGGRDWSRRVRALRPDIEICPPGCQKEHD